MELKISRLAVMFAAAVLAAGCAYVTETEEGQTVRVVQAADVAQCTHLGNVRVSVVQMARGEKFVREDLIRLARNNAAKSGADTIVAAGEPKDGEQQFDMYKCIKP
jgi:Flp pilus assembly protein CpaB